MYQIKVFTNALVYKKTINPKNIIGDYNFSGNLDSSMGPLSLSLLLDIDDSTFFIGDVIKVFGFDEFNTVSRQVYGGVIDKIKLVSDDRKEIIVLECLGYSQILFNTAVLGVDTFAPATPTTIITNIIAYIDTLYPGLFTIGTIGGFSTISYQLTQNDNVIKHFEVIKGLTGRYRYINENGVLNFGEKPATPTHTLIYKEQISSYEETIDGEDIVNSITIEYANTYSSLLAPINVQRTTVDDAGSIAIFGKRSKFIQGERYLNSDDPVERIRQGAIGLTQAQDIANTTLQLEPNRAIAIKVNNLYDYLSIRPGDTIKLKNIKIPVNNIQILKVSYNKDGATLYCESLKNLGFIGQRLKQQLK